MEGVSFGALFLLISSELLKGGDKTGGRSGRVVSCQEISAFSIIGEPKNERRRAP